MGTCDIGAYEFSSALVDPTLPTCGNIVIRLTTPRQMEVSASDAGRGLQTISGVSFTSGTVVVPYFTPGSVLTTTLSAVKANQTLATSWSFHAIDQAGNDRLCQ